MNTLKRRDNERSKRPYLRGPDASALRGGSRQSLLRFMIIVGVIFTPMIPTHSVGAQPRSSGGRMVERARGAPAALPPGTTLLPVTLVRTIDTSNAAWNPSSPDPAGVDYWPLTGRLIVADSEVDEMPNYFVGSNVYQASTAGTLISTCSTTAFSNEPTGVAVNPTNNHLFFSDDTGSDRIYELSLGPDNTYCTADDTVVATNIAAQFGINDAEDVAYGNNTLFVAGGTDAEVYIIPLGADGVLGADDVSFSQFDTLSLGFSDLEGVGYNPESGTLFLISSQNLERYLGETTTSGNLLRAYDLNLMGSGANIRSGLTYAPGSQNAAVKTIYIASRGLDNNSHPDENDGKIWEFSIGTTPPTPTPTPTATPTPIPTPPGKVTLSTPSGVISSSQPTYTWNADPAATWYYLWINGPAGNIFKQWYTSASICTGSTCSIAPALNLGPGTHTWWVRTWNPAGYGPWSDAMSFSLQVPRPPVAATLISPSGGTASAQSTYTWNAVVNGAQGDAATWYYLWVNGPSGNIHKQWLQASAVCSGGTCSVGPAVTLGSGGHTWWIRTWNQAGYGPWSAGLNFTVAP